MSYRRALRIGFTSFPCARARFFIQEEGLSLIGKPSSCFLPPVRKRAILAQDIVVHFRLGRPVSRFALIRIC